MTWLWPTGNRSPQWFVVWSFGLLALALFVVNSGRLLWTYQHPPVQIYVVPPVSAPPSGPRPTPPQVSKLLPAPTVRLLPPAVPVGKPSSYQLTPEDLPPLPAPMPDRAFATVPDNPADHPYKPLRLDRK